MILRQSVVPILLAGLCAVPLPARAQLQTQPYVTGLSFPVAFIPDPTASDRQFVVEQMGHIRVVVDGVLLAEDFLDLSTVVTPRTRIEAERGLIGMVVAPDYATSGRFFVAFTREGTAPEDPDRGDVVIARFRRSADNPLLADPTSRFDLRWGSATGPRYIEHSARPSHNGGAMVFGPDGYLYIGLGDGGGAGDPDNNAQNPMELKGKILRIDVNVGDADPQGYRVPPDNPFIDGQPISALPEIWAFGVRNPWRLTFDDPALGGTGALLIADVGEGRWEEINYEPPADAGRNYGWRMLEGSNPYYNHDVPDYAPPTPAFVPLTDPVFEYFHSSGQSPVEGYSIIGGYVYRGAGLGEGMRGRYFFADFALQRIWSVRLTPQGGGTASPSDVREHTSEIPPGNLSSFGVDQTGELYLVKYGGVSQGIVSRVCGFSVSAIVTSFAAPGGTGSVQVTSPAGCAWSVSESSPWIHLVSNTEASGSALVSFTVPPNQEGVDRDATITIAGRTIAVSQRSTPATPGDINGDGATDLLWQHTDGRLAAWFMHGTTLMRGVPLGPGALPDPAWRIVASGDFDGDASRDIVFQHETDGRLAVWMMSGTALLAGMEIGQVPEIAWKVRGSGDMNRDGWPDLIWQHEADGRLAVWLMERTALREGRVLSPPIVPDRDWRIVAVADTNGDDAPDFVWQNQATGLLATWLMDGLTYVDGILLSPSQVADTDWKITAAGDFNGDGMPDLIWQHQSSGMIAAWLMDGHRLIDAVLLTPAEVADTGWKIVGPR